MFKNVNVRFKATRILENQGVDEVANFNFILSPLTHKSSSINWRTQTRQREVRQLHLRDSAITRSHFIVAHCRHYLITRHFCDTELEPVGKVRLLEVKNECIFIIKKRGVCLRRYLSTNCYAEFFFRFGDLLNFPFINKRYQIWWFYNNRRQYSDGLSRSQSSIMRKL